MAWGSLGCTPGTPVFKQNKGREIVLAGLSSIHSFHFLHDHFYILVVTLGIVRLFEAAAKEESNGLPEAGGKPTSVLFNNIVTIISSLPIDDFH